MVRHVVLDSANQGRHTAKRAATNPLAGDLGEPAFDQIQPGGTGGDEVAVVPRMRIEPRLNFGMRVGGVVVENEMDLAPLRDRGVEVGQEGEELGCRFRGAHRASTVPSSTFNAANRLVVPWRM